MQLLLTGATGFVGSHLLKRLLAEGNSVRALVRSPQKISLSPKPNLELVQGDVVEGAGLDEAMRGCHAVIHLVGIIVEAGSATFERVHHLGTRNVVEAAKRSKIARFIQMSALGARADGVSEYQTTKWKAEEVVRQSGIPWCILRPSLIFGPGDGFVNQMLDVMRKAPLFRPVPGDGKPRFRPIFIDDVTGCFAQSLTNAAATDLTIELGGADELSLNEVLVEIAQCAGIRKPAVHVPMPAMMMGAAVAQTVLRRPPVTLGQLRMLKEGSTCDIGPMKRIFGLTPIGFREGLRTYLSANSKK
ncbi:MAG TPA: complex I NDUFA9 subunit family protein [Candidatus Angelobacter sp.]|nr:complex I NDUFA9 subunit family protein [Candidatus Angelobacter sp.]